jgi:hypothetical protein
VSSNLGWAFELAVRAASDVALHDKYNIAGFLQVRSHHVSSGHWLIAACRKLFQHPDESQLAKLLGFNRALPCHMPAAALLVQGFLPSSVLVGLPDRVLPWGCCHCRTTGSW